ncbi:MAG: SPFH domain-containing protein [Dehalococcoidia bacterium]|nr:SPFH domain-containing protein [Dehalococcoidia bacterium]
MEQKTVNIKEKTLNPANGFLMLFVGLIGLIASTVACVFGIIHLAAEKFLSGGIIFGASMLGWVFFGIMLAGLKVVKPNEARIFTLFGVYHGTVKSAGFHYVNPFCSSFSPTYQAAKAEAVQRAKESAKQGGNGTTTVPVSKAISLKKQTLDNQRQKVNDILGNPIIIGAIVIWYVDNPTQAVFSVENYHEFLSIQTDSTIRNVARLYPYDIFDEDDDFINEQEKTLRGSALEIAEMMKAELQKRVDSAGLIIEEVRITHLAYAEEIAAAMLQRQQASAIIAARKKIVDGAVGMVKMALDKLGEDNIVILDDERKATMVSNLLVVLCGNRDAQPIINSGTIF